MRSDVVGCILGKSGRQVHRLRPDCVGFARDEQTGGDLRFEIADWRTEKSPMSKAMESVGCVRVRKISLVKWSGISEMRTPGGWLKWGKSLRGKEMTREIFGAVEEVIAKKGDDRGDFGKRSMECKGRFYHRGTEDTEASQR